MRHIPIANCNASFIRKAIAENRRIDVRSRNKWRDVNITFGRDYGTCFVHFGGTLIFASCSCSITTPKVSRPNEGLIQFTIDLSPSCHEWIDTHGRQLPNEGIHCLRLLERTVRDSHCIDQESLCLINGEKVWQIKCDITCLNYEGNLTDAASVAAIASLAHFKRSDVSVSADGEITIHSFEDRHPLNLTILHYPFCVSFAFFENRNTSGEHHIVFDPNHIEEVIADGTLVVAANSYREIVAVHCSGKSRVNHEKIITCSTHAIERVKEITAIVKEAIEIDKMKRLNNENIGFGWAIESGKFHTRSESFMDGVNIQKLKMIEDEDMSQQNQTADTTHVTPNIYQYGRGIAGIGDGGPTTWQFTAPIEISDDDEMNVPLTIKVPMIGSKKSTDLSEIILDDDSEEEEITVLKSNEFKK